MDREALTSDNQDGILAAAAEPAAATPTIAAGGWLSRKSIATLALLALVACSALFTLLQAPPGDSHAATATDEPKHDAPPQMLFQGWAGKPELAIVLTGQQFGYLQPCGCSKPQYGGQTRRYNFIESLKKKGWPVVAVDVGDMLQKSGPQKDLKYRTSMHAYEKMGYAAVGVGEQEMSNPLLTTVGQYALQFNNLPRMLAANLQTIEEGGIFNTVIDAYSIVNKPGQPKVGIFGLIGHTVGTKAMAVDPRDIKLRANTQVIPAVLKVLSQQGVEICVLLYQGTPKEAKTAAEFCAAQRKQNPQYPNVDIILCISEADTPPAVADKVGETQIVTVGHKGRYLGVMGGYRVQGQKQLDFKYQLVMVGPEFDTPADQIDGHPIMDLMEQYTKEVKRDDYLRKYPRAPHPVQAVYPGSKYVGSNECKTCHQHAYNVWIQSNHAQAYSTLVGARHPKLRQYDGECIVCHTTGFQHHAGYENEIKTAHLKNVGCESCHGPGSEHIKAEMLKTTDVAGIRTAINPWKAQPANAFPNQQAFAAAQNRRELQIDSFCQKCHDIDNDVNWKFNKRWPVVEHMNPGNQAVGVPPVGAKVEPMKQPMIEIIAPNPVVQPMPPMPPEATQPPMKSKLFPFDPFRLFKKKDSQEQGN